MRKATVETEQPLHVQTFDKIIEDVMSKEEITLPIGLCIEDLEILCEAISNVSTLRKLTFIGELSGIQQQESSFVDEEQFELISKSILGGASSLQSIGFLAMHLRDDHLNSFLNIAKSLSESSLPVSSLESIVFCGNEFTAEMTTTATLQIKEIFKNVKEIHMDETTRVDESASISQQVSNLEL